jgi:hypothetical protein
MAKRLKLDDLKVESFTASSQGLSGGPLDCTGCDSGCGIFPDPQYA